MSIIISCITQKTPAWVDTAFADYSQRCVAPWNIDYKPVALKKRVKGKAHESQAKESGQLLSMIKANDFVIGLDPKGKTFTSEAFSQALSRILDDGLRPFFVIGAPEGLTTDIQQACKAFWSLGALTMPHTLAKVVLAEQIFRAYSIRSNHPYHRAEDYLKG